MEFVDGALVGRSEPSIVHSLFQTIVTAYLRTFRKQFRFAALTGVRTQIVEGARYRIPDIMLCPVPLPAGKVMTTVPWVVIEVLSPDDRLPEQLARFREFTQIGVRHIVLLDPEDLIAYRFEGGSLLETQSTSLDLPSGSLPFDTTALFQQLIEELNEGRS